MNKPLLGEQIAVLVANGFCETSLTQTQRAILPLGGTIRIVSVEQGLINSWNGEGWGLSFAADESLSEALAADYSALIVPGGQRSVDKLQMTAHTKRFINGFVSGGKPAVMMDQATALLTFAGIEGQPANLLDIQTEHVDDEECAGIVSEFFMAQYSLDKAA